MKRLSARDQTGWNAAAAQERGAAQKERGAAQYRLIDES